MKKSKKAVLKKLYALMGELQETKKAHIECCELRQASLDAANRWMDLVDSDIVKIKELGAKLAKLEAAIAVLVG